MSEMPGDWRRNRRDAAKKRASRKERLPGEDARTHVTLPVDFRGSCRDTPFPKSEPMTPAARPEAMARLRLFGRRYWFFWFRRFRRRRRFLLLVGAAPPALARRRLGAGQFDVALNDFFPLGRVDHQVPAPPLGGPAGPRAGTPPAGRTG